MIATGNHEDFDSLRAHHPRGRPSPKAPMASPGGKGDREAVDEEWRYLPILNVVK